MTAFDDGLWARLVDEHDADRVRLAAAPERTNKRPLLVGITGTATAAIAGVLVAVVSLISGASSTFAGWTAQPTTPTPAQLAREQAYCAKTLAFPGLPLQPTEARGQFTIAVYSDGSSNDFCTTGPSFHSVSSWSTSPAVAVPAGRVFLWADHTATVDGQPYGIMIARAADDVTAVNLTLGNATDITATVENGWAVAWWPGTQHLASARLTTASGTQTRTFSRYPCDVDKCHGGSPVAVREAPDPGAGCRIKRLPQGDRPAPVRQRDRDQAHSQLLLRRRRSREAVAAASLRRGPRAVARSAL